MVRNTVIGNEGSMQVPDYVEPIRGYRMWRVSQLDGLWYLSSSATVGIAWPVDQPLEAEHIGDGARWLALNIHHLAENPPVVPVRGCYCGIHAYATCAQMLGNVEGLVFRRVFGEVDLWGKVWEHERGYRAQYARVAALYDVPNGLTGSAVQTLADRYNVPMVANDFSRKPRPGLV